MSYSYFYLDFIITHLDFSRRLLKIWRRVSAEGTAFTNFAATHNAGAEYRKKRKRARIKKDSSRRRIHIWR